MSVLFLVFELVEIIISQDVNFDQTSDVAAEQSDLIGVWFKTVTDNEKTNPNDFTGVLRPLHSWFDSF